MRRAVSAMVAISLLSTTALAATAPPIVPTANGPTQAIPVTPYDASGNVIGAGGGSGSNAAASATGSAVPSSAGYEGFNSAGNLVGVSSANPLPVAAAPLGAASTNGSTTITTGNTFQTLLASNAGRKNCLVQNPADATETLYVNVSDAVGSATKARSYQVAPGGTFACAGSGTVTTSIINVTAATSGHAFVETDQ